MELAAKIAEDPRYREACQSCINCGVCTAICPAAVYFPYDPRQIVNEVLEGNEETLRELLSSDTIWYCGQCMSCKPRCPRGNIPGSLIQILRKVSIETGLFGQSTYGRQQIVIKRGIGENILSTGYCVHPTRMEPDQHPEQGPVWEWMVHNASQVYGRFDETFDRVGGSLLRKPGPQTRLELQRIFEVTGGMKLWDQIEAGAEDSKERH